MNKIQLENLKNIIVLENEIDDNSFIGFEVEHKQDFKGNKYEILKSEEIYYSLGIILGNKVYAREDYLLEVLLTNEINAIENKDIYQHGYPESRLIPSDFYETCNESLLEEAKDRMNNQIENILNDYFI